MTVEVRRGKRLLGRDSLICFPERGILARLAQSPRAFALPNGTTAEIRRVDEPG